MGALELMPLLTDEDILGDAKPARRRLLSDDEVMPPGMAEDVVKSGASGLQRGLATLIGLPGDAIYGARWLARKAGLSTVETPLPGSAELQAEYEKMGGPTYEPRTTAGEYARTIGEFAPAAIGGAAGIGRRALTYALAPAVASETAGQVTKGTAAEPFARAGAGVLGAGGAAGVGALARALKSGNAMPSTDALEQMAKLARQRATAAGVVVSQPSFAGMVSGMRAEMVKEGFHPARHPKSAGELKILEDSIAAPKTLDEIDTLRQIVKDNLKSGDASERRMAMIMKRHVDDYTDNLTAKDVTAGNPQEGVASLKLFRSLWHRKSKSELLDKTFEAAKDTAGQFSVSGMENALRTEFRKLARNEKLMRTFTKEEQKAIRRVGRGGPIENFLRWAGKLAPTGVLPFAIGTGGGYYFGGPEGAAMGAGIGFAGRGAARAMTERNVNLARALMVGGQLPQRTRLPGSPLSAALSARTSVDPLVRALLQQQGTQQ